MCVPGVCTDEAQVEAIVRSGVFEDSSFRNAEDLSLFDPTIGTLESAIVSSHADGVHRMRARPGIKVYHGHQRDISHLVERDGNRSRLAHRILLGEGAPDASS